MRSEFGRGTEVLGGLFFVAVTIWWLVKLVFIPIFIVNVVYFLNALTGGTLESFNWTWLVVSVVGLFVL